MTHSNPPNASLDAKLLGILLAGVFGQVRPECRPDDCPPEQRQSGIHRIVVPPEDLKPR
jgi:hypothetical protein